MDLSNDGTGPALIVRQYGAEPVATFYDDTTMAMIIKDGGDVSFNSDVVVDGSVGIGSNAPSELLDIAGGNIRLHNGDNLYIGDSLSDSLRFQHITNGTSYIDYNTNKPLYLRTTTSGSSTNVMHLRGNGYVGIMDTGLAGARLDVRNESDSVPALNVRQDDDAANIAEFHHGANQVMVIDNSGRLGIGITNPTQQLEVSGNIKVTGTKISIDRPSPGNYCYFSGQDSYTVFSGANNNVLRSINGFIQMITGTGGSTSERARITSGGLVGIGTDDPSTRLDISNNTSNSVLAVRQHDLVENIAEFYNGANQVMVIDNSGSLGINRSDVTTNFALDVSGAAIVSNTLRIRDDAQPEGGEIIIEGPSNSNRFHLDVTQAGHFQIFKTPNPQSHSLFIDDTTNFIGLNGASPAVELDISGTGAIRIPVGNDSTQRPYGANGMIRYNAVSEVYEAYNSANNSGLGGWGALGGGGGGSLTANSRRIPQGDVLFNVDVSAGTPYGATLFMVRKNAISDDGNRIVITDSTIEANVSTDTNIKIYDYNPDNNQYEIKQTILVSRTNNADAEGIRGVHITGDKQTILVVTANLSATDPNTRYDGSYNFIPYELTNSIDVVYTAGNTLTLQNTPWYDMDDGTTLMVGERESTNSDRDVHFYSYSSSEKQFTLKQTIPYLNDISNALPNAGTAKHVAISGDGLRALWVDGTGNNVIIFKRLSTFSEFQILQTIRDIASGSTPDIHSLYTLSNFDYHGKFLALNFATSSTSKVRIYAYDEVKFNYVSASEFTNITNVNSDLITSEPYISKDGTRLFVNHFENDGNSLTDNGVISMLKLDKQGKVPIASVAGAVITASAEFIMYGESASDRFGFDTVADYHGKRIIGAGKNTNTNTSNNNVRVIQTETTILATNTTINTSEIVTLSGSLKLYPQNNIVDISATTNIEQDLIVDGKIGIGTTNPIQQLDVRGNMFLNKKVSQTSGARLYFDTAFGATGPNKIDLYNTGTSNSANNVYGFGVEGSSTTYHSNQYHRFYTGSGSTKTLRMIIDNSNVGIGTDDPQYVLDVSGSISSSYYSDTTSYFGNAAIGYANSATLTDWASFAHIDSNSSTDYALVQNAVGRTKLNAASLQKIQFTIGNSEKMVLDRDGNVGIGTDDPRYELDVSGSITAQTVRIGNMGYGPNHGGIGFHNLSGFALLQTSGGQTFLNCASDCSINFQVNNITKMIMDKDGNVGIGTDPSNRLTILGTNNDTVPILGLRSGNDDTEINNGAQIAFGYNGTDDYQHFIQTRHNSGNSNNAIDFYVCNGTRDNTVTSGTVHNMSMVSGKVGIGSTDPSEVLDVSGNVFINTGSSSSSGGRLLFDAASGGTGPNKIDLYHSSGSGSNLYGFGVEADSTTYHANQYHRFYTGTTSSTKTERMTIKDGNVGIGTNDPVEALDVSGNIFMGYHMGIGDTTGFDRRFTIAAGSENSRAELYFGTAHLNTTPIKSAIIAQGIDSFSRSKLMFCLNNNADNNASYTASTSDARMTILPSGNVGIGTTNPETALQISSSSGIRLSSVGIGTTVNHRIGYIDFENGGTGAAIESCVNVGGAANNADLRFMTTLDSNSYNKYVERMRIDREGKVGIGTTDPSEELDVSGNVRIRGPSFYIGNNFNDSLNFNHTNDDSASYSYIDYNDNGFLKFRSTPTGGSYKTTMTLDQSGNVGIGSITTSAKLTVFKNFVGGFYGHYAARIYGTDSGVNETGIRICEKGSSGTLTINQAKALDVYVDGSSKMVVTGLGRVGIGSTLPSEALDVNGTIRATNNIYVGAYPVVTTGDTGTVSNTMLANSTISGVGLGSDLKTLTAGNGISMTDYNGSTERTIRLANTFTVTGDIQAGTITAHNDHEGIQLGNHEIKLTNSGAAHYSLVNATYGIGSSDPKYNLEIRNTSSNNALGTFDSSSDEKLMTFNSGGNVGIGTTNPQYKLDVSGNVSAQKGVAVGHVSYFGNVAIGDLGFNNHAGIKFHNLSGFALLQTSGGQTLLNCSTGQNIAFQVNNITQMTMDQYGNLGIGSGSPSAKLDVFKNFGGVANGNYTGRIYGKDGGLGETGIRICEKGGGSLTNNSTKALDVYVNGSSKMVVTGAGRVGINTTNPQVKLQVGGSGVNGISNSDDDIVQSYIFQVYNSSFRMETQSGQLAFRSQGANGIGFYTTAQKTIPGTDPPTIDNSITDAKMIIKNYTVSGTTDTRVGIGTTNPLKQLDVYGNIFINNKPPIPNGSLGGQLFFDTAYGVDGPNKIDLYNNGGSSSSINNIYGFGVEGSSTTYHASQYHRFYTGATSSSKTEGITFKEGYIGIGSTNPEYPLDVTEWVAKSFSTNEYAYFKRETASGVHAATGLSGDARNISIKGAYDIWAGANFISTSDKRIKTNIRDISDNDALDTLRKIQPKTYDYKDKIERGNATTYGFLAQQIKEVLPHAINIQQSIIPNIYEISDVSCSGNMYNVISITDFDTSDLDTSSNTIIVLDLKGDKQSVAITDIIDNKTIRVDTDLSEWMVAIDASGDVTPNEVQKYEKVILDASNNVALENYNIADIANIDASGNVVGKMADLSGDNIIDSSNNYVDASGSFIAAVNPDGHYIDASGNYFDADGNFKDASNNLVGTYKTEWKKVTIHGTKIFVYGQKVDDFHTLNKSAIFTVATAALQEVDRQLQAEKAKVSVLESDLTAEKAKTATLESQMADLLARVSALESA